MGRELHARVQRSRKVIGYDQKGYHRPRPSSPVSSFDLDC